MSRVGKQLISIPDGVTVSIQGGQVTVKGPKGELAYTVHPDIVVTQQDNVLSCAIARKSKQAPALWGTTRANIANLVTGVTVGFTKQLEIHGVGYRAAVKGKDLELHLGFSHPVIIEAPEHVSFLVEKELVTVSGINTVEVGQIAASIRAIRPPEPYKGKGVRYVGETVRRKVGKVVGATGA